MQHAIHLGQKTCDEFALHLCLHLFQQLLHMFEVAVLRTAVFADRVRAIRGSLFPLAADETPGLTGFRAVAAIGAAAGQHLTRAWRGLDRHRKVSLAAMVALSAGAIAVRAWLIFGYGQAFLGFRDSSIYVAQAGFGSVFGVQKPAGYPIFLKVVHVLSDDLGFTILVQHALGLATGVVLYKAVRRTDAPPWLGLVPAAIVFFGGTGLLLEHALLADTPFAFVQAVAVYAAVRALKEPGRRWPLLAGLAIGVSFWLKTVGLASALLVPALLLFAAPGTRRRRVQGAATCALAVIGIVFAYVAAQALVTGYVGYERQGAWNLYGRVSTFVDCSKFTPPKGTQFLCPAEPPSHRSSQFFFQYDPASPAVRRFGPPTKAPRTANALLQRFSIAAIEHEPAAYVGAVLRGLTFYVDPRFGEGYTPESLREALLDRERSNFIGPDIAVYYPHYRAYIGHSAKMIHSLANYERHTRVQGALLVVLLVAAIVGAPLLTGRTRSAAILFTLTAIVSATLAVAGNTYDARYAYPAFGPLVAGAALGAWGVATRLRQEVQRRWSGPRARKIAT